MLTIISFIFALFTCIIVHETGHLLVALWNRSPLSSINIGTGPVVWEYLFDGVWLRFRLLPLGGSVIVCWSSKKKWKNVLLAAGGPIASAVGAVVCIMLGLQIAADIFIIDILFNLRPAVISGQPTDGELILRQFRKKVA